MKAILEFDLEDNEDVRAHLRCVKSLDLSLVVWELMTNSKKSILSQSQSEDFMEGVEAVFEKVHELLEKYNINIEEIVD